MSLLKKLVGGDIVDGISEIGKAINEAYTSDDERLTHAEVMERIRQEPQALQVGINKIEAQHRTIFVAGWRPYIGWICGTALAIYFIPQYIMATVLWVKVSWSAQAIAAYPVSPDSLIELLFAMLGIAGLRTIEKLNDKAQ
jgi:hypothetical protein